MSFPPPTDRQARILWLALTGLAIAVLVFLVAALIWALARALRELPFHRTIGNTGSEAVPGSGT